jgi:hypothetical protein
MTSDYNSPELSYMVDPMGRVRFFGIYSAKVVDINDPLKKNRIKVKVQQSTGQEVTGWARACLPIIANANHPDHLPHLASEVANLLQAHATHATHSTTITSGAASAGTAHTHPVVISLAHDAHTNNHTGKTPDTTFKLTHAHDTTANTTQDWNDSQEQNLTPGGLDIDPVAAGFGTNRSTDLARVAEHTPHRLIPKVGQLVWIMFEAGDPEYPVWTGVH